MSHTHTCVAHQYGVRDWNTLAPGSAPDEASGRSQEGAAVSILRIFDRAKAVEF
jgi:hypothetical protein